VTWNFTLDDAQCKYGVGFLTARKALESAWPEPYKKPVPRVTRLDAFKPNNMPLPADGRQEDSHRPHQAIANTRPLHPLPRPITDPEQISRLDIRRRD